MTGQDRSVIVREPRTFELDFRKFSKFAEGFGWLKNGRYDYDLIAAEIGLSGRQVQRVLNRETRPGTTFTGGLLSYDGELLGFKRVFRLVNLNDPIGED